MPSDASPSLSADMLADPNSELELVSLHVGHLPLIRAVIDKLGISAVLDDLCPKDPRSRVSDGQCVTAMIINILSGRCALYGMSRFFNEVDTDVVLGSDCPPDALNDSRLASSLDNLFDVGTDNILGGVVHRFLGQGLASTEYCVHLDTTTLALQGAFDVEAVDGAPVAARGYSKDHRPDLKQLVFGLSLHGAVGIPMSASMLDGNTPDSTANRWTIDRLAGLLPEEHDVTIVGDSKLVDAITMGRLLHEGFHFVSLVPLTFSVRADLVEEVRTSGVEMPEIGRSAGRRKSDPDMLYRGRSFRRPMKVTAPDGTSRQVEMTLVVVHSDAQAEGFDNALDKRLAREKKQFQARLKKLGKRSFSCRADAEAERTTLLGTLDWMACEVTVVESEEPVKRAGPGRPKKDEIKETKTVFRVEFGEVVPNEDVISKARFHASHYVLVSDRVEAEWDAARVLEEYRKQSMIEGHSGFRWLKSIASVAPVMLKTPSRIAALGLVFVLALMVRNWIQFELRRQLKDTGTTVGGRKLKTQTVKPTTETAMLAFYGVSVVHIHFAGQFIRRQPQPLSADAALILTHLGVPTEIFGLPYEKWPPMTPATSGM